MEERDLFEQSVQFCKGVGPRYRDILSRKNIKVVFDLVTFFPRDYEDRTKPVSIAKALQTPDKNALVYAEVLAIESFVANFRTVPKLLIGDGNDVAEVPLFKPRMLAKGIAPGVYVYVVGKFHERFRGIQCTVVELELPDSQTHTHGTIAPIYPLTEGLSQKKLRSLIQTQLERLEPSPPYTFPNDMSRRLKLFSFHRALQEMHFPTSFDALAKAKKTLAFEEFLAFQYHHLTTHRPKAITTGVRYGDTSLIADVRVALPFPLTHAQERVLDEIAGDLLGETRMFRLVQGDVGSGKTIVAILASLIPVQAGAQVAVLVPTEILAKQHYANFTRTLSSFNVTVSLLTAETRKRAGDTLLDDIREGRTNIVIGTHALLTEDVRFNRLSFVIVDEQQRFGVRQRDALLAKGDNPDYLLMTATPIPQSLTLTLFGELTLSLIDELPPGRKEIRTKRVDKNYRAHAFRFIESRVRKGEQAYVVYPMIDEQDESDLLALTNEYEEAKENTLAECAVGIVHGRMKDDERERVMRAFQKGDTDVLFATSVIEVGIDNPNATTIMIEGAERFGLSQLHQLRGRVGRGGKEGYCYLVIHGTLTDEGTQRMDVLCETNDGFIIAERDLAIRGPGEFLGTKQSGLPEFRVGSVVKDTHLMRLARTEAVALIEQGDVPSSFALRVKHLSTRYALYEADDTR